jgi:hypothetical protein
MKYPIKVLEKKIKINNKNSQAELALFLPFNNLKKSQSIITHASQPRTSFLSPPWVTGWSWRVRAAFLMAIRTSATLLRPL